MQDTGCEMLGWKRQGSEDRGQRTERQRSDVGGWERMEVGSQKVELQDGCQDGWLDV